jgi:hypothetical protein
MKEKRLLAPMKVATVWRKIVRPPAGNELSVQVVTPSLPPLQLEEFYNRIRRLCNIKLNVCYTNLEMSETGAAGSDQARYLKYPAIVPELPFLRS